MSQLASGPSPEPVSRPRHRGRARATRLVLASLLVAAAASLSLVATPAHAASVTVKVPTTYAHPVMGEKSPSVKALQKRLHKAGTLKKFSNVNSYYGQPTKVAVQRFQRAQHLKVTGKVDKKTWRRLVQKTGSINTVTSKSVKAMPDRCKVKGRVLCIDKKTDTIAYLVDGTLVQKMDVRFGCAGTETRLGTFKIFRKSRDWVSTIYGSAMPFSMFFSGGQAVHYSSDFAARGYAGCSHGCVNVRDYNGLKSLYSKMEVNDRVVVYRAA